MDGERIQRKTQCVCLESYHAIFSLGILCNRVENGGHLKL